MEDNKEMRIYNVLKIFFCVILLSMPYCASAYSLGTALVGKSEFVENDMYMLNIPQQDSVVPPPPNRLGNNPEEYEPDGPFFPVDPGKPVNPDSLGVGVIDMGNSVGTPKGVLDVSSSGAAVYSMAFEVPNGGPLTPQVGIAYNSQSGGYGLVGYGFNITGISAIT